MRKGWKEPTLDDLMDDPILDVLLAHNGMTKDALRQLVEQARADLARVPSDPAPLKWSDLRYVF